MDQDETDRRAQAVRRFNRFYTRQIGVLQDAYLKSPFSLSEARVIYELAQAEQTTASDLIRQLQLDPGYLSRILKGFHRRGLLHRETSPADGRQTLLSLTDEGRQAFAALDARSQSDIGTMLAALSPGEQERLVGAMRTIESLLTVPALGETPYVLRSPKPGDLGWVVQQHGVLYAEEYGWSAEFEAFVAGIVARLAEHMDPARERCWIAEMGGENVGSVFVVQESEAVAKLRMLLVEPRARGLGLGTRLVQECIAFSRAVGYRKIRLWTNSILSSARHIYAKAGFVLVEQEPHHSYGVDLVGEIWELDL